MYSELLGSIQRRTRSLHHAHDVLHDALLRFALTNRDKAPRQPHAYLRTVVRAVLIDRHHDAIRWAPLNDTHPEVQSVARSPSEEHLADIRQRLELLQRILDSLPPRCREVFWLFRVEGHTQPEIAARLGISLNMVERHVMRALVDLRAARELALP